MRVRAQAACSDRHTELRAESRKQVREGSQAQGLAQPRGARACWANDLCSACASLGGPRPSSQNTVSSCAPRTKLTENLSQHVASNDYRPQENMVSSCAPPTNPAEHFAGCDC